MRDVAGSFGKAERCLGIAVLLGTLSCTGVLEGTGQNNGDGPGPGGGPGPSGTGGSGGSGSTIGPDGIPTNPGRGEMHRLNTTEYNATVKDVLGTTLQPAKISWRGGELEGFDNVASVLGTDKAQFALYVDAAQALSDEVFANPTLKAKFVSCATADDAACVSSTINKMGLKIFRRQLRADEVTTYSKVYSTARGLMQDHDASLKHVLWSLLSSAEFLYRIELPKGTTKRPLDGFELASRMSYMLWTSAPDDTLLEAAAQGKLSTDAEVQAQFARMLTDGKSARFIEAFAGQWLGGRKVVGHAVAPERFPAWTPDVATAAMGEMYAYFEDFLRTDRVWTEFLTSDTNYVNEALAPLYGITGVTGTALQKKAWTSDERVGFLGLAGFLTLTSMDRRTSPTLRGKWVLGSLLCTEAPPPPKDVPKLEVLGVDLENGDVRAALESHRTKEPCAGCHAIFDPFGMALEKYDAIGKYRETYANGSPIDASASMDGVEFSGILGAADVVTKDPMFKTCFAEKAFIYGLGRSPSVDDKAWVKVIEKSWETEGGLTIKGLLQGLITSVPFRNSGDVK